MAMGTRRKRERQQDLWIATSDVVETPANAFYDRLNQILDEHKFDAKVERLCQKFYKKSPYGRPSMAPGVYFRSLLIGYFEGESLTLAPLSIRLTHCVRRRLQMAPRKPAGRNSYR